MRLLALLLSTGLAMEAKAVTITLNAFEQSRMFSLARDSGVTGNVREDVYPASTPYLYTASVAAASAWATTSYDLSDGGFEITFDHHRTGALGSSALSHGMISFSVDEDVTYIASGGYSASDPDGRHIKLAAQLRTSPLLSYLFQSSQMSLQTKDESFTLGLEEGDSFNLKAGSTHG